MPEIKGDGLDMSELMKMFASKNPPDNTINRIKALEDMMSDVNKKLGSLSGSGSGSGLNEDAMNKLNDLLRRV